MLLTQTSWEDKNPARSKLINPYTAFRCVAVPPTCFLIQSEEEPGDDEYPINTYLVATAEDLLEVVGPLDTDRRIFVIDTRMNADGQCNTKPISSILSYVEDDIKWFSYQTSAGNVTPFLPWQRPASEDTQWTTEWSSCLQTSFAVED